MDYYQKYLKYKSKYINLKEQQGGVFINKEKYNKLINNKNNLDIKAVELENEKKKLIINRDKIYKNYLEILKNKLEIVLKDKLDLEQIDELNILQERKGSVDRNQNNTQMKISINSIISSSFTSIELHFFIEIDLRNVIRNVNKSNLLTKEIFCSDDSIIKKEVLYYKLENFGLTAYDINHVIILDTEYPIDVYPNCNDRVLVKYFKEKNEENGTIIYNYDLRNQ